MKVCVYVLGRGRQFELKEEAEFANCVSFDVTTYECSKPSFRSVQIKILSGRILSVDFLDSCNTVMVYLNSRSRFVLEAER